jgi:PKD repeat protein
MTNSILKRIRGIALAAAALVFQLSASATTIVVPTDEQLIAKSPVIVAGSVVSSIAIEADGVVWTESVVDVVRTFRGNAPTRLTVRDLGGATVDRETRIYGRAEYAVGERVLAFLEPSPRGGFRTVDLFVGKFTERRAKSGERLWTRDDAAQQALLLDAGFRPIEASSQPREASRFETFIEARVAGRPAERDYTVALEPSRGVQSEFELLDEPTIYRWTRFDSNQSAVWFHHGTQSGYSDGGITELRTAIAQWSSYSAAQILYSYSGSLKVAPGGLTKTNGQNEVLFGDPLDEIPGSWDGMSGVVGMGGFNNHQSGPSWNAPFDADAAHKAGAKSTRSILEANLTIQDGVTPGSGIPSHELAEILSHELGHTLGFGHSADSSALMYFQLVGAGPQLRADDQLAARWLYPRGATTPDPDEPTIPLTPSNLRANVAGSSVELTWTDRASNETGHSIYLASSGSAFVKVGDVGANAISARITGLAQGSYQAYVVAFNAVGASQPSNSVSFSLVEVPVAAFTFTPQSGTAGQTLFTFTDQSTGPVGTRLWTFGDGSSSTSKNPTHVYAAPGQYTVTLLVNGNGLVSQLSKAVHVSGPLEAQFVFSPAVPTTSTTIQFSDLSSGAPSSWNWSFGDGTTSTAQNPAKRFAQEGTYSVSLTIERAGVTSTATVPVTVDNDVPVTPAVVAAFDASTTTPSIGAPVTFTDRSSGAPSQWLWEFGDGGVSTAKSPTHAWSTPGTYTVKLTASNAGSASIATREIVVGANAPHRTLVPVAAQTGGVGGTSWRTELTLFNPGADAATVTMLFLPAAGGNLLTRALFLPARQSITYENALLDVFGVASGAGAIAVETSAIGARPDLRITSRTFTGSARGTYGQAVPDVKADALDGTLYLTALQSSDAYRTNVGLVNRASETVTTAVTLYTFSGGELATKTLSLDASSFQQLPLVSLFPEIDGQAHDVLSMRVASTVANAVSVYASVVDNATQDPIYVHAVPSAKGRTLTIPVIGRAEGANGTFWRSDVTLFNPTASRMTLAITWRGASKPVILDAHDTAVVADVIAQFGETAGSGTLVVSWSTTEGPVVTSRTYTSVATGGTYGQSIDPVAAFSREQFVPGLRHGGAYRSNVGIVNGGAATETVALALYASDGSELARTTLSIAPGAQSQSSLGALFPGLVIPGSVTLHATGDDDARLFVYGSMVDNESGDPVFFSGS